MSKPMICAECQSKARYVNNGRNDRLNYWYCDKCKDVAKDTELTATGVLAAMNAAMQPLGPNVIPHITFGTDSNGIFHSVSGPSGRPCVAYPDTHYGKFQYGKCNCGMLDY